MAKRGLYTLNAVHYIPQLMVIFVLAAFGAVKSIGQTSAQEFRGVLRDQAGFTADDFSTLERGETVVKLLPVKDRREVAVCGLMRLQVPLTEGLQAFQQSMTLRNRDAIMEMGKFSSPPALEDLEALTLEDRDLEDLKRCVVGNCKVKMSAAMIERFGKEVDWTAIDHRSQATRLFRQMLIDYVRDYLARGDAALIEYHDQSRGVRLAEEHRSLLEASLYINDFAPELTRYVKAFPQVELPGVEKSINWTKIKFGLKPVTIITHVMTSRPRTGGASQIMVVSKQLYANHYFDSAMAVTALFSVPTTGTTPDSYLLYTNRSRADALAGSFSKLKRNLVEGEALTNLNNIMLQTRLNLENRAINQTGPPPGSGKQKIIEWLFGGMRLYWWLIMIIVLLMLFGLRKRHLRRNAGSLERDH